LASPFRSSLHASNELTSDATISFKRTLYLLLRLLVIWRPIPNGDLRDMTTSLNLQRTYQTLPCETPVAQLSYLRQRLLTA
jgi:hypothetical protein